jgi:hypothetical protein
MKTSLRVIAFFALVLIISVPLFADTIHLKDGNVIRGQVIGFRDQQFTVLVGSGSQGRRSRTIVYIEDVESIEFDSATTAAAASLANDEVQPSNSAPVYKDPVASQTPVDNTRPPVRSTTQPTTNTTPTFFTIRVSVRADNANNGWTNSGLVVRKGQRIRISATGRVSLGGGRFSTPTGLGGSDNEKLMRGEATGAMIAVIGDDNDDFLLIGSNRDFVAQRDGVLFLGVNEGNLADNTGSYDVVINAEAAGR